MTTRAMLGEFDGLSGKVVDGDTLDCIFNLGLGIVVTGRVRLFGINAPEISSLAGKAARDFLKTLLPEGTLVRIETFEREKFGRFLSEVFRTVGLQMVNVSQEMVDAGHAIPFLGTPNPQILSPFPGFAPPPQPLFLAGARSVYIGGKI